MFNVNLPEQAIPFNKKDKEWRIQCVNACDSRNRWNSRDTRTFFRTKLICTNLINNMLDYEDLMGTLNPNQLDADFIPEKIQHHPIINSKLNTLIGEEIARRADYMAIVTSPDAISQKEEELKSELNKELQNLVQDSSIPDDQLRERLEKIQKKYNYSWQDRREIRVNRILNNYSKKYNFNNLFTEGFRHALIMGEEIYNLDIDNGEPKIEIINPLYVYTFRSGMSSRIEDSDVICIDEYWNPSRIIDTYYEDLSEEEIKRITQPFSATAGGQSYDQEYANVMSITQSDMDYLLRSQDFVGSPYISSYDANGNIRVLRAFWRSLKEVKKVKYFDEYGDVQYKIMSAEYIPDTKAGETCESLWVNEWWEGTKIMNDIFVRMRPKPVQYNSINNPSICHPGIVGRVYNIQNTRAVSLVEMLKPFQYMYDVVWYRLNKLIAKNIGKVALIDINTKPESWTVDKWMYYLNDTNIMFTNGFNENKKGDRTGALAGQLETGRVIDMELGGMIQQCINLLEYIKSEIADLSGITKQREGQINSRETVGGVERAISQSSFNTELYYATHELCIKDVLTGFLETAKLAFKGNKIMAQYILDDGEIQLFEIDGDEFAEADYGIQVINSNKILKINQRIEQLAEASIQNGGSISTYIDVLLSDSIADKINKLEAAEEMQRRMAQEAQEQETQRIMAQIEANQRIAETELELKRLSIEMEKYKNDNDNDTKLQIAGKDSDIRKEDINVKKEGVKAKIYDTNMKREIARLSANKIKDNSRK